MVLVETGTAWAILSRAEDIPAICDDAKWAFSYTAGIDKDAAGNRAITVNLMDASLNRADGLALGSFELDFTIPSLSSYAFSAQSASSGASVTLELVFNATLKSASL